MARHDKLGALQQSEMVRDRRLSYGEVSVSSLTLISPVCKSVRMRWCLVGHRFDKVVEVTAAQSVMSERDCR